MKPYQNKLIYCLASLFMIAQIKCTKRLQIKGADLFFIQTDHIGIICYYNIA